jgi:hypothetical protein
MPSLIAPDALTPGRDDAELETVMPLFWQSLRGRFERIGAHFNDLSVAVAAGADFVPGVATALHARRSIEAA